MSDEQKYTDIELDNMLLRGEVERMRELKEQAEEKLEVLYTHEDHLESYCRVLLEQIEYLEYDVSTLRGQVQDLLPWAMSAASTIRDGDLVAPRVGKPEAMLLLQRLDRGEFEVNES